MHAWSRAVISKQVRHWRDIYMTCIYGLLMTYVVLPWPISKRLDVDLSNDWRLFSVLNARGRVQNFLRAALSRHTNAAAAENDNDERSSFYRYLTTDWLIHSFDFASQPATLELLFSKLLFSLGYPMIVGWYYARLIFIQFRDDQSFPIIHHITTSK